ncbi:MAG: HEAT repeat domain-containing protein [Sedimentisphaerales bacterium]|nr:HEAT repeat domain-containing protein [Sedimentisphaerales bacterium]
MKSEILLSGSWLWTCVWQSTIFAILGLTGSYILKHRSSRAHQVLLLSMVAAVIVPAASMFVKYFGWGAFVAKPVVIHSPKENPLRINHPNASEIIQAKSVENSPVPAEENTATAGVRPYDVKFPWYSVLMYGWIAASAISATRLLVTFLLGFRLLKRASLLECKRIDQAILLAKENLGINKDVKVYCSHRINSPVIWCWRRNPALLVPSAAGPSGMDWTGVVCHELAHTKRRDHISGLLAELAVCIFPWQLLLWFAKSRLRNFSELACDDWVIAAGQSGADYAESLLDLVPGGQMVFAAGITGSKKELANRIRRIVKDRCGNPRAGRTWVMIVSLLTICLSIGMALAQIRPAEPIGESETDDGIPKQANVLTPEIRKLISTLSSDEWQERQQAATDLARTGADAKPAVPALTNALTDEQWHVRKAAAEAITSIGPAAKSAIPILIELLGDEEWFVRRAAAEALTAMGPAAAPAVPSLIVALDDVEWHVRRRAAEALAAIGTTSKPATRELIKVLNDEEWLVRRPAALALGAIGPSATEAIPTLIERLEDPEWQVRHAVADALEKISIGDKSTAPQIIEALLDREWKKRQSAAQALQKSLQENNS